jgi:hypothetical protein
MLTNQRLKAFVSTTQPDKARLFYINVLGLKLLSEDQFGLECESNGAHLMAIFFLYRISFYMVCSIAKLLELNIVVKLKIFMQLRSFLSYCNYLFLVEILKSCVFMK